MKKFAQNVNEHITSVKENFDKLLSVIFACIIIGFGIGNFFSLYVKYIVEAGYGSQIEQIKALGAEGVLKSFTTGNSIGFYGTSAVAAGILIAIYFALVVVSFYKNEGKVKGIAISVDEALLAVEAICWLILSSLAKNKPEKYAELNRLMFPEDGIGVLTVIFSALAIILIILFVVLLINSSCKNSFWYGVCFVVAYYLALPAVLLLLENIVPLVIIVLVGIAALIIAKLIVLISKATSKEKAENAKDASNKEENADPISLLEEGKKNEDSFEENLEAEVKEAVEKEEK